jgi:hypothetical protein
MEKIALVVFADNESHENLGRVVNAMTIAREFKEHGDEVSIVFDGGGTTWIPTLAGEEHAAHELFESVRDVVAGACRYCAGAFGVRDEVEQAGIRLLDDYEQNPSIRSYVVEGYDVLTF